LNGLHDHIHGYVDENADISHIGNIIVVKDWFSKLDKDNDGYASGHICNLQPSTFIHFRKTFFYRFSLDHELEPVLDKLYLFELYYSRQQPIHAISEVWFILLQLMRDIILSEYNCMVYLMYTS
jgi:calumenin